MSETFEEYWKKWIVPSLKGQVVHRKDLVKLFSEQAFIHQQQKIDKLREKLEVGAQILTYTKADRDDKEERIKELEKALREIGKNRIPKGAISSGKTGTI